MPIVPEIEAPIFITVEHPGSPEDPMVHISVALSADRSVYAPTEVRIEHPFVTINGTVVRSTPVRRLLSELLPQKLAETNPELMKRAAVKTFVKGTTGRRPAQKIIEHPGTAQLVDTALVFTMARMTSNFPIRAVQRCFALDYRHARRWVAAARRQGLL